MLKNTNRSALNRASLLILEYFHHHIEAQTGIYVHTSTFSNIKSKAQTGLCCELKMKELRNAC